MRSMSDLNLASKLLDEAKNGVGRKPDDRFRDLCKSVQHIITHLKKLEKDSKQSDSA